MTSIEGAPVAIIGGGIFGLAIGAELSQRGNLVFVFEKNKRIGEGATSRNSGVIHLGMLSASDSLRQRMAVTGRERLLSVIQREGISHRRCGKLVVATSVEEVSRLTEISAEANRLGIECKSVSPNFIRSKEPALKGHIESGCWFPGGAVYEVHELLRILRNRIIEGGGEVFIGRGVTSIHSVAAGVKLFFDDEGSEEFSFGVNAAGIDADGLLARSGVDVVSNRLQQEAWVGRWFRLKESATDGMRCLVYRTSKPNQSGLGVHTTPDVIGEGIRIGPDSERMTTPHSHLRHRWPVEREGLLRTQFLSFLQPLYPHLKGDDLLVDQVGIRSRYSPCNANPDHRILNGDKIGLPNTITLLGMESPGLTNALAIAKYVADKIR